jgi:hypothetical protein
MNVQPSVHSTIDLTSLAERLIDASVAVTTGRLHLPASRDVRKRLVARDPIAISYFRHELARQVAATLLMLDPLVTAVHEEQDTPPAEELAADDPTLSDPLRLIVVVEFRTAALDALIRALNDALGDAVHDVLPIPARGMIEATVTDDPNNRLLRPRAYGYHPAPLRLASREDAPDMELPS